LFNKEVEQLWQLKLISLKRGNSKQMERRKWLVKRERSGFPKKEKYYVVSFLIFGPIMI